MKRLLTALLLLTTASPRDDVLPAPSFARAPHAAREDILVDYRPDQIFDLGATLDRPRARST